MNQANYDHLANTMMYLKNVDLAQANDIIVNTQDPAEMELLACWLEGYNAGAFEYMKRPLPEWYTRNLELPKLQKNEI